MCGSVPVMTNQRDTLRDDVQFRILHLLRENPEMSQRDLAKAIGINTGGTHYVLGALLDKGLLKLGNFTAAVDKRRYAYVLTPKGIARICAAVQKERNLVQAESGDEPASVAITGTGNERVIG